MIGGVTRYMLPHLPGVPNFHVNRPINFSYNCYAYYLLVPLFFPHCAQILLEMPYSAGTMLASKIAYSAFILCITLFN